ncbi:MAG TPA: hypothetical protein PLA03_10270, partial [Acidobacteriota bacterium]|nr:hypothetical protein [Acidobacteriota bacterium]
MTKSRLFVFFTLTFMVTLLSIGIWGQEISYYSDPWMQTPGFRPEMPYRSLSENESVNIFNGNLTAIIPVGPSFPCGPSLSFQARLRYVGPYSGIEGSYQDYYGTQQGACGWSIDSNVAYRDNAGKWVLMFGKIHEKIINSTNGFSVDFVEQDGTAHSFYQKDLSIEMGYTNDGSGIRLFRFPGEDIRYVVYMPSGTIMEFGHGLTHSDGADYFVTRVSDRDGNSYRLIYDYTPEAIPHHNVIKIYNEAIPSRQITFSYENQSVAVPNYIHYLCQEEPAFIMKTKRYLSKISMPAPRGSVVEYNLNYDFVTGGMPSTLVNCSNLPQVPPITTILLREIAFPDTAKISFEYYQEDCTSDLTAGNMHGSLKKITYPGGGTSSYEYSFYRYYSYIGSTPGQKQCNSVPPPPDCMVDFDILDGVGVSKHTVDDGLGNESITTWYRPVEQFENHERVHAAILEQLPDGQLIGHQCKGKCNTPACSVPKGIELKTFYFDNANSINLDTFFNFIADEIDEPPVQIEKKIENIWEIGGVDETNPQNPEMLPQNPRIKCSRTRMLENGSEIAFSQTENSYWDGYGHYKVTKIFGTGLQAPKLIMRKFNLTEVKAPTGDTIPQQGDFQRYPYFRNRQIVEVVSESDPSSTQQSCIFAGLLPGNDDPIPDPGDDDQLTSFQLYSLLPPAGTVTQSPNTKVTWMQYEKHRVSKRVEMNRLLSSAAFIETGIRGGIRAGDDFTINYNPISTDNRITYEYDNQGQLVSAQLENALSKPAAITKVLYGWQNGVPSSKQYAGFAYFEAERLIDPSTGLVLDEIDSNHLTTSFSYDEQGRLVKIAPPNGEIPTWISYPMVNENAQDIVYYRGLNPPSFSGSDPLVETIPILDEYARYHFDGLGRLVRTAKLAAANEDEQGHEYTYEDIGYDAVGRKIFTSLPYSGLPPYTMNIFYPKVTEGNSLFGSSFITVPSFNGSCPYGIVESLYANASCNGVPSNLQKDPLGRVRTIISPDGNVAKLDYNGFDTITTIEGIIGINVSEEIELTSVKTSHYDALGRLTAVDEPIGTDGIYRYDTMDRLIYAELGVQKRLFSYDTNGLLMESFQPENGLTKVLSYDVWGNPLQIEDAKGRANGYVLENSYDLKGRKLSTSKKTSTETTLLSQLEYDQPSGGTYYLNRLTMEESQYPWSVSGIININESFRYDDPSGRISERTTSSTGIMANSGKSFHVSYGYDQYGRVVSEGLSTPFGQNMIFNNYMHGYLDKRIFMDSGLGAQKILYHPSGAIKEIQLNGSKKIQRLEEAGTGRLQEIVYGGWRTGSYIYDGAGNISQIGANDKFYYDELSRLKQASVGHSSSPTGAVDNIYSFEYKYDDFGNMWQRKITQTKGDSTGMPLDYSYNAAISTANNRIGSILAGSGSYLTGSVVYDPNGNQTAFNGWNYTYDELNRLKMGIKGDSIPRYYYNPEGERLVQILKTSDTDGESTYYFKDGIRTIGELQYKMSDSQVKSITEKFFLYVGSDILATSEKQYSMTVGVEPVHSDDADPSADFVARPCIKNYANGIQQQAIVSLSDVVAYESNGQNFDASYTLEHISQDIAGVMVRIARIKDQGNSNDNGNGCPRNDEDKVECRYFLKEGLDADFVFGGFGLCGNEEYGTISEIEAGQVYPVIFTDLQKDKAYRVRLYAWTSWAADPNLGFNIMKVEEGQLLVPKKDPSTYFEMRGMTTDEGQGFTGKLRARWGQLSGTTGYNVKAIKKNGETVVLNGNVPVTGNSYQIDENAALAMGVASDASYQLEAIILDPTHPIIIGPIKDDLLPIICSGGTSTGYSIPTLDQVKVFNGEIAYISWDKGQYPAPYYKVFQRVSAPGSHLGPFIEIGVTNKDFFVYTDTPQITEDELLAYAIQPLDQALIPVTDSSFMKLAEFIGVTNSAPRPRNMSIGDGNRIVEVNWTGYAQETDQGPWGTSEPITFDSESGLYYELFRGYNPSMTAMGCETFSLADFTLKQTTFEPFH